MMRLARNGAIAEATRECERRSTKAGYMVLLRPLKGCTALQELGDAARQLRIGLDTVTFGLGSWKLSPDQIERLVVIAESWVLTLCFAVEMFVLDFCVVAGMVANAVPMILLLIVRNVMNFSGTLPVLIMLCLAPAVFTTADRSSPPSAGSLMAPYCPYRGDLQEGLLGYFICKGDNSRWLAEYYTDLRSKKKAASELPAARLAPGVVLYWRRGPDLMLVTVLCCSRGASSSFGTRSTTRPVHRERLQDDVVAGAVLVRDAAPIVANLSEQKQDENDHDNA